MEFLNIAKDDALAWPKQARREYPETARRQMDSTVVPFVKRSLAINNTILEIFTDRLGLPSGSLLERHRMDELSGSETRIIRNGSTLSTTKQAIGSHTDFGSLVCSSRSLPMRRLLIMNRLVLPAQPIRRTSGVSSRVGDLAICKGVLSFFPSF